jgi:hypothetical protein
MTGRIGFGYGVGISFDPNGGTPGPEIINKCESGVITAFSGSVGFNAGPLTAGFEKGVGRNYSSQESAWYGGKGYSFSNSFRGISATGSIGASVTIYSGKR